MKKILIFILGLLTFSACEDLTSLDKNPKQATTVEAGTLFANGQKNLVDFMTTPNVNTNIFRLLAQQWTETTYIDESNYDISTRNIPQNVWHTLYRDVLKDLDEAKRLVTEDKFLLADEKASQLAMIDIIQVYTWSVLVDTFGDIPYSEALDYNKLLPTYDDAETIYADLVTRLNSSIGTLTNPGGFADFDLFYGGDAASWVRLANSIKLKLGMTLADVNPTGAKGIVESAVTGGVFTSSAHNAVLSYLDAPPNTNPVWVDLVQSGRKDFVAANTIVDKMNALNDPRRDPYFTFDITGLAYVGGIYGSNNNYATYSKPDDAITVESYPALLMDYVEVEFYLAEAIERGYAVGGTAAGHYTNAITASMTTWGVSAADITTYLALPAVAYATATGTYKQKIGEQKWIALYNRGFEAWNEWKRLDFPALIPPVDAETAIPVRYTYPVSEQNLNKDNYNAAAASVGGDAVTTKVFWDMN